MTGALGAVQVLLALVFLFAGGSKLVMPIEEMTAQVALPGPFLRFIGVAEILGALGLILPGSLGIRPGLTPLVAAGLVIIMIGATAITLATMSPAVALIPRPALACSAPGPGPRSRESWPDGSAPRPGRP